MDVEDAVSATANFIMRNAPPAARDVADRDESIALSERDTVRVLELLENPPEPTPALLAAVRRRATREGARRQGREAGER